MKRTTSKRSRVKQNLSKVSLVLVISLVIPLMASDLHAATNQPAKAAKVTRSVPASQSIQKNDKISEFTYTLDLAKKLVFSKIVNLIEAEDYAKALTAINTKIASNFECNAEATSGYQNGFFAEALKGICLEKTGEVVKAYRAYQNARYYCDEEKASWLDRPFPALKLELYVAIGRMCNKAGRYTDALAYLEDARMVAAEYSVVAAEADRALIKRAVAIGDLEEAAFMYKDLKSLVNFKKEDFEGGSKTLFELRKDRQGFKELLEGLTLYGIDNDLGVKDPLVISFLAKLPRAEEQEISQFYDLLGYEILKARGIKGDEDYLTFLINCRLVFSRFYDNLEGSDDLALVKARIDEVAEEYKKQGNTVASIQKFFESRKKKASMPKKRKKKKSSQEFYLLEDKMMTADLLLKQGHKSQALKNYESVLNVATGKYEYTLYDGTSFKNAIVLGMIESKPSLAKEYKYDFDSSHRVAAKIIGLYNKIPNETRNLDLAELSIELLPIYHPKLKIYTSRQCNKLLRLGKNEKAIEYGKRYLQNEFLSAAYKCTCQFEKSFSEQLETVLYQKKPETRLDIFSPFFADYSWAKRDDIDKIEHVFKGILIYEFATKKPEEWNASINLKDYYTAFKNWIEHDKTRELEIRNLMVNGNYQEVLDLIMKVRKNNDASFQSAGERQSYNNSSNRFESNMQSGHSLLLAKCYLGLNNTNDAYRLAVIAYEKRSRSLPNYKPDLPYPTPETELIEVCVPELGSETMKMHIEWLKRQKNKCQSLELDEYVGKYEESINEFNNILEGKNEL